MKYDTKKLVLMGLFAGMEILLAFTPLGFIPLGITRPTTIHIPVIIGAILMGPKSGAILGGFFGLISLLINTFTPTATSFVFSPFYSEGNLWSIIIAIVPRVLIGITAYYSYKLFSKVIKKQVVTYAISGVIGSITNTILVIAGIYIFFGNQYALTKGISSIHDLFIFLIGLIGVNGIPEAIVAGVLTAGICMPFSKYIERNNLNVEEQSI